MSAGQRFGRFEILGSLGAGGMGEVYRARDLTLGREVAIKVLAPEFTADTDRLKRFEREAHTLAALNHPNIGAIYGFESVDAVRGLVLELVEGETLAARIAAGLASVEAMQVARQIVEALDAAHDKGIVHRDLKPANIKVTPDATVKVLDFGIAKPMPASDLDRGSTATVTLDRTREGVILGTAAYMSPEQVRGAAVDKRADIWAFGCVLFEMLAGHAPFARATIGDTLAAVLESEPDWEALPRSIPQAVRRLIRRCLDKDAKRRLRDIGDARLELEEAAQQPDAARTPVAYTPWRSAPKWLLLLAGIIIATSVGVAWWFGRDVHQTVDRSITRTTVTLPANQELDTSDGAAPLAISQDGRRLAYVAAIDGHTQLYLRALDAFDARPLAGTEGARYPFFSPDGEWVAFFADRKLKRASIRGGAPLTICDAPEIGRGGTWGVGGMIVFDPGSVGLMRVAADGGQPELLTSKDLEMDRGDLSWPQFLPDGRGLLATLAAGSVKSMMVARSMETGEWRQLGPGSEPRYLGSGHLIYHAVGVREGELHAVAFEPRSLTTSGAAVSVLEGAFRAQAGGAAYFAVAQNGTLIFMTGGYGRTLVRVDRTGSRTPLLDEHRGFRLPAVSPDGTRVAVTVDPRPSQVWVYDLARQSRIALTTEGHSLYSSWTPDGSRIAYASGGEIWVRAADAGTPAEPLLERPQSQFPTSWSADGRQLIYHEGEPTGPNGYDIGLLSLGSAPRPLIATQASELDGRLSPNGRWLAYYSDESGRFEVFVRPFPNVAAGKWAISTAGGQRPIWAPNGKELFYVLGSAVMAAAVETAEDTFRASAPAMLFKGPFDPSYTGYALAPDGSYFLMVEVDPTARPTQVNVVLNWSEELKHIMSPSR